MNQAISDPDTKINMSLDEIIRLTHGEINNTLRGSRTGKRKGKFFKKNSDHSVPLLTSSEGVSIYVSKKSPLLSPEIKKSILKAVTNRALNAELLKKSARIIPAKYKLIKTDNGIERILVPVKNYVCKPVRKLSHQKNSFDRSETFPDGIPPLLSLPLVKPVHSPYNALESNLEPQVEVDGMANNTDDDVVVLQYIKKEPELIDVEMNVPVSALGTKQLQSDAVKTLNYRFTRLTGNLQF